MPYSYHKEGDKYVVTKKDTGKEVGRTKGTKEALKKYLAALHINANEGKNNTMKKTELKAMIQEVIKEVINEYSVYQGDVSKIKPEATPKEGEIYLKDLKIGDKFSAGKSEYIVVKPDLGNSGVEVKYADGTGNMKFRGSAIVKVLSEQTVSNKITEAYVPNNIKEFAKRKGASSLVNTVAGWAEKVGKGIRGGTAIGKNYDTLILDMGYQTADIYINTEDGTIELYGEPVRNFNEFKKVWLDQMTADEMEKDASQFRRETGVDESVDYDTAVAYRITVPGNRDEAMTSIKTLLDNLTIGKSKKFPEVKVTLLSSKGNPQDLILKLNGPGAFSMSKDIKARPELKNMKVKKYSPQLTKIS
jgi:hypothetical protein